MRTLAALRAFGELVLPTCCAGCEDRSSPLCAECAGGLVAAGRLEATQTWPSPTPPGFPPTWSQLPYDGPVAAMLRAFKDAGRRDLADRLGPLLRCAIATALRAGEPLGRAVSAGAPVLVVPVPSRAAAVRSRGREPLVELTRHALAASAPALQLTPALRIGRRGIDQAGLGADARSRNVAGTMTAGRGAAGVPGATCLLVDDIVTTGSTLAEAARALYAAGACSVSAVTVAATQRHTAAL